ncbi:60S ribosomal protein L14 [Amphibalanus amphitrite]|uniref:Large ribosomal subunit protein eL14 n=1 Tax=Amphibalanus amphitrite TaxID=1232801 RepID=A0A6A4VL55_AMPAM|nr:60S ribosomal protein L14-like [Amphibalanus amphitrite]KAF0291088.1 60S ribosomal protein L14 [Amphibalanus amphitrite]
MGFTKFIQVGRVVYMASGPLQGKICAVVNIIDQNRVLVDGPCTAVRRQVVNLKNVHITNLRIRIPHTASTAMVREQWVSRNISSTWEATRWCRNLRAKQRTESLTDFERFKLWKLRKARTAIIRGAVSKLKIQAKKNKLEKTKTKKGGKKVAKKPAAK